MDDYCNYICEGGDSDIDCSSGEGKDAGENGKEMYESKQSVQSADPLCPLAQEV